MSQKTRLARFIFFCSTVETAGRRSDRDTWSGKMVPFGHQVPFGHHPSGTMVPFGHHAYICKGGH
jgi:hypothetical protein